MGCDYYIQTELVIQYKESSSRINTIYTNRCVEKGYIFTYKDEDSDDDEETAHKKYKAEIQKRIKENTFDKLLFQNEKWVKESYEKKYKNHLIKSYSQIAKIIKVYKKTIAWERM